MFDLDQGTLNSLLSLLGLLNPSEYFITVDHSVLWQRHIAWSKPRGEDLRQYVTQRYASNMVFLSCLLACMINVFFNSSDALTDMRSLLYLQSHGTLRYWIGVCIISNICVTIVALVSTFTLWGMVSSISDSNTHALLRSSIGQSVTSLPPKFTVAALYLFLLWISLFIVDLLKGPIQIVLLVLVSIMFFQVVIPLSAFGRLIIHTGAMAKRPVLDKELEKELLPSGLHASLLIRATDRRRKYSSATDQYRKQNLGSKRLGSGSIPSVSNAASSSIPSSYFLASQPLGNNLHPPRNISINRPRSESDELTSDESASSVQNPVDEEATGASHTERPFRAHRRIETFDTVGSDLFFPGASILNASTSRREIKDVVDKSMYMSSMPGDIATNSTFSVSMASTNQNDKDNPNEMNSTKRPNDNEDKWYKGTKSSGRVLGLGREGGFDAADGDPNAKSTIMSPSLDASPTLSGSRKIHPSNGTLHRDMINFHPLLTRSPAQRRPPAHRPPKHQRGLSSASRRSSGSLLGFIREFEEENEVRALFDVPPAADLEAQERLVDGIEASTQVQQNPSTQPTTIPEESMENGQAKSIKKKSTRPTHKDENSAMEATHLLGGKGSGSNYI